MKTQQKKMAELIDDYSNIPVPYRSQKQQQEKQEAYRKRLTDITNNANELFQEINLKMQQYIDVVRNHQSYNYSDDGATPRHGDEEEGGLLQQQMLDREELKIQGEAAYMEEIIGQRQDELNDVEKLMTDINSITKDINAKVHEQRKDLVEIDHNAGVALDNAEAAEQNIEEAQEHQKSGGRCMYWTVAVAAIVALVIILIVVLSLV